MKKHTIPTALSALALSLVTGCASHPKEPTAITVKSSGFDAVKSVVIQEYAKDGWNLIGETSRLLTFSKNVNQGSIALPLTYQESVMINQASESYSVFIDTRYDAGHSSGQEPLFRPDDKIGTAKRLARIKQGFVE